MGLIDKLISGGITNVVDSVAKVADEFITTDAERAGFKLKVEEQRIAAKQAEDELAARIEEAHLKDIADSRQHNAAIQQSESASWLSKNVGYILDLFVAGIWGCITIYIILRVFNLVHIDNAPDLTNVFAIYASLTGTFAVVLQWHRGSSSGSAKNGEVMRGIIKGRV